MSRSLPGLGLGVVLGAFLWPWLEPGAVVLSVGLWAMALLCICAPSARTAVLSWAAGGLLLGALAVALQLGPIPPDLQARIQGEVVARQGHWVRVRTALGQARLRLGSAPPQVGTQLALWTRPSPPPVVLPGARDPGPNDRRRRLVGLRVREWVVLGGDGGQPAGQWHTVPNGGVLRALATGDRSEIPQSTQDLMRQTGTIHLMAISGLHVGLVSLGMAGLVGLLTRPLVLLGWAWAPRWLSMTAAAATAWGYGSAVGWPASAQRAGWVAAAALLARALGRPADAWNFLGLAAIAVVLTDPGQVGELGFQLSFGAVVGILLWAPKLIALGGDAPGRVLGWLLAGLGATMGAMIGTLPVLAWDFQHLAPVGMVANLIATPLIGTVSVPAALIAAHGPSWAIGPALALGSAATELALRLLDHLAISPQTPAVGPLAALGLAGVVLLARRPLWALVLAVACLIPAAPPQGLVVSFPAIGQGSSALIEWPDGRRWLIDGGPPSVRLLRWLRRRGIRHLDKVILSHAHPDHLGGLGPVLRALEVDTLWAPERPAQDGGAFFRLWRDAAQRGVDLRVAGDPGLRFVHPPPDWEPRARRRLNERSLVLRITHGAHSFLFTGDIEAEAEARLAGKLQKTTVVQVPHHGSRTSSSPALVDALDPQWAVIPVGAGNRFGHPAPEVIARWGPAHTLRTDTDGTIRFRSDGHRMVVEHWLPKRGWRQVQREATIPRPTRR
jgi:competence protein ComEC